MIISNLLDALKFAISPLNAEFKYSNSKSKSDKDSEFLEYKSFLKFD